MCHVFPDIATMASRGTKVMLCKVEELVTAQHLQRYRSTRDHMTLIKYVGSLQNASLEGGYTFLTVR